MAAADSDDGEIGRGRRADSSSSRESSPQPGKQKRSFTPTSDDGDIVIPPIIDDDTPPPESAPIIRQSLAFSGPASAFSAPVQVQTYQANVPKQHTFRFLPGQEVPIPSPPQPKPKKQRKPPARKTRHFNDEFASQTGSFRLRDYTASANTGNASAATPLQHGSGPYSSMYRASASAASPTISGASISPAPSSRNAVWTTVPSGLAPSTPVGPNVPTPLPLKQASATKAPAAKRKGRSSQKRPEPQQNHPLPNTSGQSSSYYRRDYDKDKHMIEQRLGPSQAQGTRHDLPPPSATPRNQPHPPIVNAHGPQPSSSTNDIYTPAGDPPPTAPQKPLRQTRMLTVLIEDIRNGAPDHQLAEIRVPLRPADNPEDGYWADSKEVVEKLQKTPSRIDGPAKVYTLRGKYRQFFLRIGQDGVEDCHSANLCVSIERTLDVIVETNVLPGSLPPPPKIPADLLPADLNSDSETMQSFATPQAEHIVNHYGMAAKQRRQGSGRKRRRSVDSQSSSGHAGPSSYHHRYRPRGSPSRSHSHSHSHSSPSLVGIPSKKSKRHMTPDSRDRTPIFSDEERKVSEYYENLRKFSRSRRSSTPPPAELADTQEEIDETIVAFITPLIQEDRAWMKYMESRAKPQRVSEVLKQYEFVQGKIDTLDGTCTPIDLDGAPAQLISREHVLQVLNLTPEWGSECTEMLTLLKYYGEDGNRFEDSRIIQMVNDTSLPQGNPAKRCLRSLRDLQNDWLRAHPEDAPPLPPPAGVSHAEVRGISRLPPGPTFS